MRNNKNWKASHFYIHPVGSKKYPSDPSKREAYKNYEVSHFFFVLIKCEISVIIENRWAYDSLITLISNRVNLVQVPSVDQHEISEVVLDQSMGMYKRIDPFLLLYFRS